MNDNLHRRLASLRTAPNLVNPNGFLCFSSSAAVGLSFQLSTNCFRYVNFFVCWLLWLLRSENAANPTCCSLINNIYTCTLTVSAFNSMYTCCCIHQTNDSGPSTYATSSGKLQPVQRDCCTMRVHLSYTSRLDAVADSLLHSSD